MFSLVLAIHLFSSYISLVRVHVRASVIRFSLRHYFASVQFEICVSKPNLASFVAYKTKWNETKQKHERDYSNIEPIGYFPFLTPIPEFGRTESLCLCQCLCLCECECVCEWCFLYFHIIISQIMIFMSDDRPILYTRSFILKAKHTFWNRWE